MSDYSPENVNLICEMVAEGKTMRQISASLGFSLGSMLRWTTLPEHMEQYARARESAADIFETDIIEAALSCGPESASSDRVKIDALKWVAARRAPKKYGDRIENRHTDGDGNNLTVQVVQFGTNNPTR